MDRGVLTFAGQAGFLIQSAAGTRVGIDLYLSDCCARYFGFKRLMPFLLDPLELKLDLLVATHGHYDHFDPDAVPLLMTHRQTRLLCARDVAPEAARLHLDPDRITYMGPGDTWDCRDIRITAVPCDHGAECPQAVGLLVQVDGVRCYLTGDTCFRADHFSSPLLQNPDILILPINGAFGNLNEAQAAQAAALVGARLTIPCHYWNFAEHGGNPALFVQHMQALAPELPYLLMRPGEQLFLPLEQPMAGGPETEG